MSAAAHTESSPTRQRGARRWHAGAVGLIGVGALLLSACSSSSDDDAAAVAAAADTVETTASTAAAVGTTTPTTEPPTTEPPDTEPPDTEPAVDAVSLSETIVAEGTITSVEGSRVEGPPTPEGRVPFTSLNTYEGDLVGETTTVGSYLIGDETVDGRSRVDFTGELVGVGSGTFTYTIATTFAKNDGTGEGVGEITGGTGVFTGVIGTITLEATDFGANYTYRIEFVPADQASAELASDRVAAAAEIADEIASSFTARSFVPIQRLLGTNGAWIAIDGEMYDASTVTAFLEGFDFIESIERAGEGLQGPDGVAFEMSETYTGGGTGTFWLVVSYDDGGALVVTELQEAPQW